MADVNFTSGLNFLMPIFSFLFVFIFVYALLAKTKILGDNKPIHLFISFLLAVFFIVNLDMGNYLVYSVAWIVIFFICLFLILTIIMFTHEKLDVVKKPWVAWVLIVFLILFFIVSSSYFFSWALNWDSIMSWIDTEWFGFVLLLILAGIVSWILSKE